MASVVERTNAKPKPVTPDGYERFLAYAALLLLAAILLALGRGFDEWGKIPWTVWAHLSTVLVAVALTPVMLLRRRGDARHRLLGRIWVIALVATAALSFAVRGINHGGLSYIHLLSAFTLVQVPLLWWSARNHRVAAHRIGVRGVVTGGLLVAGFFTFPFGRLLGHWLFG